MSLLLHVVTEVRVLEEDPARCSLDCDYHELTGSAARCHLFGLWLERRRPGCSVRCAECVDQAREVVEQQP